MSKKNQTKKTNNYVAVIAVSVAVVIIVTLAIVFFNQKSTQPSEEAIAGEAFRRTPLPTSTNSTSPPNKVILYEHKDFAGASKTFTTINKDKFVIDTRFNDKASSIQILGNTRVTLYTHVNYTGKSKTLTVNHPKLADMGFNDKISSLKIEKLSDEPCPAG